MHDEASLRPIITPHFKTIEGVIRDGFDYYHSRYADECFQHTTRSRASLINDHIVQHALQRLVPAGAHPVRLMQRRLFDFGGQFLLHFKKLNRQMMTSNYPTLFAMEFNRQYDLPGLPATLPRLVAGYIPLPDWSGIESVCVTCPDGNDVAWSINLSSENATHTLLPLTANETAIPADRPARIKRANDARGTATGA